MRTPIHPIHSVSLFVAAAVLLSLPAHVEAAAGTQSVASPGQPAYISPGWPEGVADLVNDRARTSGWNDWFSGWPNDVNHYALKIKDMADLNRLVRLLGAVDCDLREVRLSSVSEPKGLGWVTSLPEGNGIPVMFSIGDQKRVDQWAGRLAGGKFGVMQFEATPVAVPPTLTIFVPNEAVDLGQLEVPQGVVVSAGYCPRQFHKWNMTTEKESQQKPAEKPAADAQPVGEATKLAAEKIDEFLKRRAAQSR